MAEESSERHLRLVEGGADDSGNEPQGLAYEDITPPDPKEHFGNGSDLAIPVNGDVVEGTSAKSPMPTTPDENRMSSNSPFGGDDQGYGQPRFE